jgi:hypothetical protein
LPMSHLSGFSGRDIGQSPMRKGFHNRTVILARLMTRIIPDYITPHAIFDDFEWGNSIGAIALPAGEVGCAYQSDLAAPPASAAQ